MSNEARLQDSDPNYGKVLFNMMASIMHAQQTYAALEKAEMQRSNRSKKNAQG